MEHATIETITFKTEPASRRLLVAFAHPDDESFGPAGTLIRYAKAGVAVHYVCGTRGEAGSVDPHFLAEGESLADLRTRELLCAAPILGLTGLHFLNYHDSGMENSPANQNPRCLMQAPVEEVAEKITRLIRQIRPQVVLTFDPTGGYFHPDHIHMHRATTLAFHAAADPARYPHHLKAGLSPYAPQKLYYTAFPRGFIKIIVRILPLFGQDPAAFGRNRDVNLKRIADSQQTVTTKIYVAPHYDDARRAAACHASQIDGGPGRIPGFIHRWLSRYNLFTRAIPPPPLKGRLENDLFNGVE